MTHFENYLAHLQRFGIRPGLERVRALLRRLGDPQNDYPVILIGGTNGKGSTCEFLARRLASENKRVGLFTSPHLYRWNERLRVLDMSQTPAEAFAGSIADDDFDALFEEVHPLLQEIARDEKLGQPTEFETLTASGLFYFARKKVDIAVVEVGLGGKWDATNVIEPLVSVVTHVALDHCDRLGNTHVEIARDKVEIARAGRIFVTAETRPDVLEVFRAHCDEIGARLWSFHHIEYSNDAATLKNALALPQVALTNNDAPDFQILNTQTAFVARLALAQSDEKWKMPRQDEVVSATLTSVPGRFQIVRENPTMVLDGANNPDGAAQLAQQLQRVLGERPDCKLVLVLGILQDKDYRAMIAQLAPLASQIIATQSSSPRACPAQTIATEARGFCAQVETVVPVRAAVERALLSSTRNDLICVTGSFYTLSEV